MAAVTRVALGGTSVVANWYLDIDTAYPSTAAWVPVSGLMEFKPDKNDTLKDASTFDGHGAMASQKTADQWVLSGKLRRAPQLASLTAYDVGQEKLRTLSELYGTSNLAHVRWYEVNGAGQPVTEAWEGVGCVSWKEDNASYDDIRVIAFTITAYGAKTAVSPNPGSV